MSQLGYQSLRFLRRSVISVAHPAQKLTTSFQSTRPLSSPTISQLTQGKQGVKILWSDQQITSFPYAYLRDNNPNAARPLSGSQREVLPEGNIVISPDSNEMIIRWDNGNDSVFPIGWLASRRQGTDYFSWFSEGRKYHDWDAQAIDRTTKFEFEGLQSSEQTLLTMLQQLQSRGFALVVNAGTEGETAERFASLLDTVPRPTHYSHTGINCVITSMETTKNLGYKPQDLLLHTDSPTSSHPMEVLLVHCSRQVRTAGGENWVTDGLRAAEHFRNQYPIYFNLLSTVPVHFREIDGSGKYNMQAFYPILNMDYENKIKTIRFGDHVRGSRFAHGYKDRVSDWYKAYCKFSEILYDEPYLAKYRMQEGDLLVLDNTRMLHNGGRCLITDDDRRVVYGSFISWIDVMLKIKSLTNRQAEDL